MGLLIFIYLLIFSTDYCALSYLLWPEMAMCNPISNDLPPKHKAGWLPDLGAMVYCLFVTFIKQNVPSFSSENENKHILDIY